MALRPFGFIGPSYQTHASAADSELWQNLYLEKIESGDGASPGTQYCARLSPGKKLLVTLGDSPVSCIVPSQNTYIGPTNTLFYALAGNHLYAITATVDSTGLIWTGSATQIASGLANAPLSGTWCTQLFPAQIIVLTPTFLAVLTGGILYYVAYGAGITATNGVAVGSSVSPTAAGAAYAVNDTFTVDGGQILATGKVLSVNGTGGVLTYQIIQGGNGYATGLATTTTQLPQPGNGTGLEITITAVGSPGWVEQAAPVPYGAIGNYVGSLAFIDNYLIASYAPALTDPQRRQFFVSQVSSPTIWQPLDFAEKAANPDPLIAVFAAYENLYLFGAQTIEVWQDTGAALFPFQRIPGGGVIQNGLAAPDAICKMDNTVVWLGSDERGQYIVWSLQGLTPVRISNHAIEDAWQNYNIAGANMYSYVDHGHTFCVINFPIPDVTWVYDSTLGPALGWHQRTSTVSSVQHADLGRYFAYFPESLKVVGDYSSGKIFVMNQAYFDEAGTQILRVRICPHVATGLNWNYFNKYRLHCSLSSTGGTSGVQCFLYYSDDGGVTYGNPQSATFDGTTTQVLEWYPCGRSRNRVVQWSMAAAIDLVLVEMYADVEVGSG